MPGKTVRVGADSNTRGTSTLGITDDEEDVEEEEEEEVEDEVGEDCFARPPTELFPGLLSMTNN